MKYFVVLALVALAVPVRSEDVKKVTLTGWFSDEKCAPGKLTAAKLGPSNPDCSAECIRKGAAAVFISETREIFTVKDYPDVADQLGFHVEIQATLDREAKNVRVQSVKQLGWDGAACSRPRKPASAKFEERP
jgi:hypothetical protein